MRRSLEIVPDCVACGACCRSHGERYVRVRGDDYERLGDSAEQLVTWIGNEAYMKMVAGRCVALTEVDGQFLCAIYERRPQPCRELERASGACAAVREQGRGGGIAWG